MFKILYILLGLFTLVNITYGTRHRIFRGGNSTNSSISIPFDDYYDHYDYFISDAYKHKIKLNVIFSIFLYIF